MALTNTINLEYSIYSDRKEVPKVINQIMTFLKEQTLLSDCECMFDVKVVLNELISNAVIHGNRCDKSKPVDITVIYDGVSLEFTIIDRGQEFTEINTEKETLLCEDHRGISICHVLCKKLIYEFIEGRGNSARAVFILKEYIGGKKL